MERVHNFCAGPCTLPVSVIQELADELPDFQGTGMSLIEMSHRDPVYDEIHHETMDLLRELCSVPEDFSVLLLQGGATLQFAMMAMNLLTTDDPAVRPRGGFVVSGSWGKKAIADASLVGDTYAAWSGADNGFTTMPSVGDLELADDTRFLHVTSNETIGGIRLPEFFETDVRQVGDMSSDYLTRAIPWDKFDLVYGGAQKNLGPAGLAVAFVRNSVLADMPKSIPAYLRYETHAESDSLANTPPVFSIWATGKVLRWIKANGGIEGMERRAIERSSILYQAIDSSDDFYQSPVDTAARSHTNVVFRIANPDLEGKFLAEAETEQLMNLKGHRSVGGIRASVYNALPTESVQALEDFMQRFAAANG